MSKEIKDVIENTKEVFLSDSSLQTVLDFERVLDELDIYVFRNWKEGELVEGPVYEKYFVTCTFMWPYQHMPEPRGAKRLFSYNCEVEYNKDVLRVPTEIKDPGDFESGTHMPKMKELPIWLVTITMPKQLMQEIHQGSLELESATLDLEDLEQAHEEGDGDGYTQDDQDQPDSEDQNEQSFA